MFPKIQTLQVKGRCLILVTMCLLFTPALGHSLEIPGFRGGTFAALPSNCQCLGSGGDEVPSCGAATAAVQCRYDRRTTSHEAFDLPSLRTVINLHLVLGASGKEIGFSTSPVVVEAWGGVGGKGADDYVIFKVCTGGSGGERGYARTTLFFSDLDQKLRDDLLYLYVARSGPNSDRRGGKGGPSSVVIGQPLEDQSLPNLNSPELDRVIVAGAGSGGGSACGGGIGGRDGRGGGDGGCAISATVQVDEADCGGGAVDNITGKGGDGGGGSTGGKGGSFLFPGGGGFGGSGEMDLRGENGLGGFGGRNWFDSGWIGWDNSDLTHEEWGPGSGGLGDPSASTFASGGGGGGGFGGGGGGDVGPFVENFGGGGGGGAWALRATADESSVPFVGRNGLSGREGAIVLSFGLVPETTQAAGAAPHAFVQAHGSVKKIGRDGRGRVRLHATFFLINDPGDQAGLDLRNSRLTLHDVLDERDQELVSGLAGLTLVAKPGSTVNKAEYEYSGLNAPRVKMKLRQEELIKEEERVLKKLRFDLEIDKATITEPQFCADQGGQETEPAVAALVTRLVLNASSPGNGLFKLEVPEHWQCKKRFGNSIRRLQLPRNPLARIERPRDGKIKK